MTAASARSEITCVTSKMLVNARSVLLDAGVHVDIVRGADVGSGDNNDVGVAPSDSCQAAQQ
jgi:hypothetical protein